MAGNRPHRIAAAMTLFMLASSLTMAQVMAAGRDMLVDRGRTLAGRLCSSCHAIGRQGPSPQIGAPPFRDLGRRVDFETLCDRLAEGLVSGHPAMPVFRFTWRDRRAFIAYLKSVQTR